MTSASLNEWVITQNKFIPDLESPNNSPDSDTPIETVWTKEDFTNFPTKFHINNLIVEKSEHSISDEFGEYIEHGILVTARKSAYLSLAWLTLAAIFRNAPIDCEISHPASNIRKLTVGLGSPWTIQYGASIALKEFEYSAKLPFRNAHQVNQSIERDKYPVFRIASSKEEFPSVISKDLTSPLYDQLNGFGSLAGHIFMTEFFLDMSRPSFVHLPHQNYLFENEWGYTCTATASHIAKFASPFLTGHFPEDIDPNTPMSGTFTNRN